MVHGRVRREARGGTDGNKITAVVIRAEAHEPAALECESLAAADDDLELLELLDLADLKDD